jgi:hypothetical protein
MTYSVSCPMLELVVGSQWHAKLYANQWAVDTERVTDVSVDDLDWMAAQLSRCTSLGVAPRYPISFTCFAGVAADALSVLQWFRDDDMNGVLGLVSKDDDGEY